MKKYLLICIYCLFIVAGYAQESLQDSLPFHQLTEKELKKQKKQPAIFIITYWEDELYPDFGLLIGGSALMAFRMNERYHHAPFSYPCFRSFHVQQGTKSEW